MLDDWLLQPQGCDPEANMLIRKKQILQPWRGDVLRQTGGLPKVFSVPVLGWNALPKDLVSRRSDSRIHDGF